MSGYDDVVSSSQDRYTTWVKTDPDVTLDRQMVDTQKAVADNREAAPKNITLMPTCGSAPTFRRDIYNWNPGPRRVKEGAIERQIARKVARSHHAGVD